MAARDHPSCVTWSCRYLHDPGAVVKAHSSSCHAICNATCSLCDKQMATVTAAGAMESRQLLMDHVERHKLRSCSQSIFSDQYMFAAHLQSEHDASWVVAEEGQLKHWQRIQFLEVIDGQGIIRTLRLYANVDCCGRKETGYSFMFVDL